MDRRHAAPLVLVRQLHRDLPFKSRLARLCAGTSRPWQVAGAG
ncbi:hypothetical protein C4K40_2958 [Pseudomonas sp. CMR5c]|nr:hypothetical protein C4K40_2958 [Pseudomonas sp. CMR5c]